MARRRGWGADQELSAGTVYLRCLLVIHVGGGLHVESGAPERKQSDINLVSTVNRCHIRSQDRMRLPTEYRRKAAERERSGLSFGAAA